MNETLIRDIAHNLTKNLPKHSQHARVRAYPEKSSIRLYYPEFDSSHYEICFTSKCAEVAFSFTGSKAKNTNRLALFENHLYSIQQRLGHRLNVEPVWQTNWARVAVSLPKDSPDDRLAERYAELMLNFLDLTYPILLTVFETVSPRSNQPVVSGSTLNPKHYGAYAILSDTVAQVQDFLQGRTSRPTDDQLCDWVHFCYTFKFYKEGARLFELINQTAAQPWLYERAQRLAKVCRFLANHS